MRIIKTLTVFMEFMSVPGIGTPIKAGEAVKWLRVRVTRCRRSAMRTPCCSPTRRTKAPPRSLLRSSARLQHHIFPLWHHWLFFCEHTAYAQTSSAHIALDSLRQSGHPRWAKRRKLRRWRVNDASGGGRECGDTVSSS